MNPAGSPGVARIARVELEGDPPASAARAADRTRAVADLEAGNSFALAGREGPYVLRLAVRDGRLLLEIRGADGAAPAIFGLALGPFRGLIRDYEMMLDSHEAALAEGRASRIQAIDMGRRGIHDEAAALLRERLAARVAMDHETARLLFTLLCALHRRL